MEVCGSYYGLRAELYDFLEGGQILGDEDFYRQAIKQGGGAALEVGCGTGRLIIPYLIEGLEVEGVDASSMMLDICNQKALEKGITPTLHHQSMQNLDISKQYKTIYIPFFTFQFLYAWEESMKALERFYNHLELGGQLIIATYVFREYLLGFIQKNTWHLRFSVPHPSGNSLLCCQRSTSYNLIEQTETAHYRYEIYTKGLLKETQLYSVTTRCYGKHELTLMLQKIGFRDVRVYGDYDKSDVSSKHSKMIFHALK